MKLQVKCDDCGKIGTSGEIQQHLIYERDLCGVCTKAAILEDLKNQHASKQAWLEETHLKDLRELERRIDALKIQILHGG